MKLLMLLLLSVVVLTAGCGGPLMFGGYSGSYPYGYGPTYGWTPGHVERVCEQRSNGAVVCFDRFVGHPLPGDDYPYRYDIW